jgi:glycosyltransferase involved in cell wall biosynthesis
MVLECNCEIKHSGQGRGNALFYLPKLYYCLIQKVRTLDGAFDYFLIPQNNRLVVPLAFLLSRLLNKQVIIDAFDIAQETALLRGRSRVEAKLRFWIEKMALHLADRVLALTEEFKKQYVQLHSLDPSKVSILPPGADETKFFHLERPSTSRDDFLVLYWGNYLPHHGVSTIVQAAELLAEHEDIRFVLAGDGFEREEIHHFVRERNLSQVEITGFISDQKLMSLIADAYVCLGVFSKNIKAQCSITNKVSEAMAIGRAVITTESPATKSIFKSREEVYLVPPENPRVLADAILTLKVDPSLRLRLEQKGRKYFENHFSENALGERLVDILQELE